MIRKPPSRPIRRGAGMIAGLAVLVPSVSAFAFDIPSGMQCYKTASLWNAPNGSVVASRSEGPIATVINALGEERTHTMFSHGPAVWDGKTGWATHSTALPPSATGGTSPPIKARDLSQALPGMTIINMGGAYAYHQGAQWVRYQWSTSSTSAQTTNRYRASHTADWIWWSMPYKDYWFIGGVQGPIRCEPPFCPTADDLKSSVAYIKMGFNDSAGFHPFTYGFHQYMAGANKVGGWDEESARDRGIVCSQVPAYAYAKWAPTDASVGANESYMTIKRYSKEKTVAAGQALINSVYSECRDGIGSWEGTWLDVTSFFGFGPSRKTVCNRAAAQVVNCFLNGERSGGCDDTSLSKWDAYVASTSTEGAQSLSPDGLLGWSGWPTGGSKVGPWAPMPDYTVQWNGGGSYKGCWYTGAE